MATRPTGPMMQMLRMEPQTGFVQLRNQPYNAMQMAQGFAQDSMRDTNETLRQQEQEQEQRQRAAQTQDQQVQKAQAVMANAQQRLQEQQDLCRVKYFNQSATMAMCMQQAQNAYDAAIARAQGVQQ